MWVASYDPNNNHHTVIKCGDCGYQPQQQYLTSSTDCPICSVAKDAAKQKKLVAAIIVAARTLITELEKIDDT